MKKMFGFAAVAGAVALTSGAAHAQSISANVTLASDYVFRGLSLSGEDPVVQGGFDYEHGLFYAGVWGSSLGSAGTSMEADIYAGVRPQIGPVALDLGLIGYFYPGADDDFAESDFFEAMAAANIEAAPNLTLGVGLNYSPDMWGETGEAWYYEINGAYALTDAFALSARFGRQSIADLNGPLPGSPSDDYNSWNLGATYAFHGFEFDLRYHDSDIGWSDTIAIEGFATPQTSDGRVVLSVSRAL